MIGRTGCCRGEASGTLRVSAGQPPGACSRQAIFQVRCRFPPNGLGGGRVSSRPGRPVAGWPTVNDRRRVFRPSPAGHLRRNRRRLRPRPVFPRPMCPHLRCSVLQKLRRGVARGQRLYHRIRLISVSDSEQRSRMMVLGTAILGFSAGGPSMTSSDQVRSPRLEPGARMSLQLRSAVGSR